jgi:hypothetical protein
MLNTENPTRNDDAGTVQIPKPRPEGPSSLGSSDPGLSGSGSHGGRIMTALRRVIHTSRYIHGEMTRASALMFPQPRPRDDARRARDAGRVA